MARPNPPQKSKSLITEYDLIVSFPQFIVKNFSTTKCSSGFSKNQLLNIIRKQEMWWRWPLRQKTLYLIKGNISGMHLEIIFLSVQIIKYK